MEWINQEIVSAFFTGVLGPLALFVAGKYFKIPNPLKKKTPVESKPKCPVKESIDANQLIDDQLDLLMDELGCDRIWLTQFHNGGHFYPTGKSIQKFSTFYEHITPETPSVKHTYQNIPVSIFNRPFSVLYSEGEILIYNINDKDVEKLGLNALSKQYGAKSSYVFGLFDLKERYLGNLIIDYCKKKHTLSDSELTYTRQKSAAIGSTMSSYLSK
tara:strand:+ start:201 stop:845 length:645 start_codon:yes stop_codon:yes gene_type:complete